ncbi:hypothetical protein NP493_386g03008 [Ridgeia piscesae]|uniref:PH domain-containing protein n=1 Tax=Ridgeia piscesae TaxID=27915 RepID=A0AAD9L260_RIDPI|nr:hypothetical protein NP493_386g03008 [Ridgeia piscesae]
MNVFNAAFVKVFIAVFMNVFNAAFVNVFIAVFMNVFNAAFVNVFNAVFVNVFIAVFMNVFNAAFVKVFIAVFMNVFNAAFVKVFIAVFMNVFNAAFVNVFIAVFMNVFNLRLNDFAYLVGDEYLKYFELKDLSLDAALRCFLKRLTLTGETQECERILAHFSNHYVHCNTGVFNSEEVEEGGRGRRQEAQTLWGLTPQTTADLLIAKHACHTLTCALMLLNTDLHTQTTGRRMTLSEFIDNLADLNDGENFPKEVLKNLYHAIKTEPLQFDLCSDDTLEGATTLGATNAGAAVQSNSADTPRHAGHNPFLEIPDPAKATEYKKGYVMRKCCVNPDGRHSEYQGLLLSLHPCRVGSPVSTINSSIFPLFTPFTLPTRLTQLWSAMNELTMAAPMGKRGWKMFYATLRDTVLYLHKDEHGFKRSALCDHMGNAIRVHHALATKATDYKKKQHVFRLKTADWAQYLFQTSDSRECQEWIDTINFVAAMLSAPPLPSAIGSQKKFQRPLLPSSYTKLNMREQMLHHENMAAQLEQELKDHRRNAPDKGSKSRTIQQYCEKESYLQYELKRFKMYSFLMQARMTTYPELEPSLVEIAIGEVDEPPASPPADSHMAPIYPGTTTVTVSPRSRDSRVVQRSQSDRYSYRAAIYTGNSFDV